VLVAVTAPVGKVGLRASKTPLRVCS